METITFKKFKEDRYKTRPWDYGYNSLGFKEPIPGCSDISAHLPFIEYIASRCAHCTEFGTRDCFSTSALIAGCPGKVVSYDLNIGGNVQQLASLELPCDWRFIQVNTLAEGFEIDFTDLLFVDTLHTYNQVKGELAQHAHNVGHYIMFHDTYSHGIRSLDVQGEEGIMRAIEEFLVEHPEWKNVYQVQFNHGLIMLEKF